MGLIYRPPLEIDQTISESIPETSCRSEAVIKGDFNLPVMRWGDPFNFHTGRSLFTNEFECDYHQHVNKPTRDDNIFDLIFSTTKISSQ